MFTFDQMLDRTWKPHYIRCYDAARTKYGQPIGSEMKKRQGLPNQKRRGPVQEYGAIYVGCVGTKHIVHWPLQIFLWADS